MFGRNVAFRHVEGRQIGADQLDRDAIGVAQTQNGFAELLAGAFDLDLMGQRPFEPIADGAGRDGERQFADLASPGLAR